MCFFCLERSIFFLQDNIFFWKNRGTVWGKSRKKKHARDLFIFSVSAMLSEFVREVRMHANNPLFRHQHPLIRFRSARFICSIDKDLDITDRCYPCQLFSTGCRDLSSHDEKQYELAVNELGGLTRGCADLSRYRNLCDLRTHAYFMTRGDRDRVALCRWIHTRPHDALLSLWVLIRMYQDGYDNMVGSLDRIVQLTRQNLCPGIPLGKTFSAAIQLAIWSDNLAGCGSDSRFVYY